MAFVVSGQVYRFRSVAFSNLVLDLTDGSSNNGTPTHGWQDMFNPDFFNQMWRITSASHPGFYNLCCLRSGTYLDLSNGSSQNGTQIQGWQQGNDNHNQNWAIERVGVGTNIVCLRNQASSTYMHVASTGAGGGGDGTRIWGWQNIQNHPEQQWELEEMSFTSQNILVAARSNPFLQNLANAGTMNHYADMHYLLLPMQTVARVFNASGLAGQKWRAEVWDCDDFAYAFKVEMSKFLRDNIKVDGVAAFCGVLYGRNPAGGGHAFNWLFNGIDNVLFFEPQNGQSKADPLGFPNLFFCVW